MRFKIDATEFGNALKKITTVVKPRAIIPSMKCVRVVAGSGLALYGMNGEQAIMIHLPVDCDAGEVMLPARLLTDFVSRVEGEIVAEGDQDGLRMVAGAHKVLMRAPVEPDRDIYMEPATDITFEMDAAELADVINRVAFSAGKDDGRPALMCVHLAIGEGRLRFEAADSYRLAMYDMYNIDTDLSQPFSALVPASSMSLVPRLIGNGRVTVSMDNRTFTVREDGMEFSCLQTISAYPNLQSIVPQEAEVSSHVVRDALLRAAKTAYLFSRDATGAVQLNSYGGTMIVKGVSDEHGNTESRVSVSSNGDFSLALNAKYLIQALSAMDGELVEIVFAGQGKPVLLTQEHGALYVIMPMIQGVA